MLMHELEDAVRECQHDRPETPTVANLINKFSSMRSENESKLNQLQDKLAEQSQTIEQGKDEFQDFAWKRGPGK